MEEVALIIVIFVCGIVAILVELVVPGVIIGLIGFLGVVGSIIYAFAKGHSITGAVLVFCTLAFMPVFFMLWKSVLARFFALTTDQKGFRPSTTITEEMVGVEGEALSPLRPSGIAMLNDRRYDVVTRGEMLEKGARIKVIEISGNRVVVKKI